MGEMHDHNFHGLFSLSSNISYFEDLLHSFRSGGPARIRLRFLLDNKLRVSPDGKPRINLMLYWNSQDNSIEFSYPWIAPILAKLVVAEDNSEFTFRFNKNYLRFSKIVAEGWELIDIFRSMLQLSLIERGMCMIHGAAISLDDEGILIPSFGNTGKTSSAWLLAKEGAGFVTDEFAILDPEGRCFGFPCSSLVSPSLIKAAGLRLTKKQSLSLRLREASSKILSTRFAPGGLKLPPENNFKTSDRVLITRLAFIQNGLDDLRELDNAEAFSRLRAIQDYELNWRSNPYIIARAFFHTSFNPQVVSAREEVIIRKLISRVRGSYLVSSSEGLHYQRIKKIPEMFPAQEQPPSHPVPPAIVSLTS